MKVKWLGHASFLITSEDGKKLIIDPYTERPDLRYGKIKESADIVIITHGHSDHNNTSIGGNPEFITRAGTAKIQGIPFKGIATYHDEVSGKKRGNNIVFCFEVDRIKLCHLGDLGHHLTEKQLSDIGNVDILFIPVGGYFTIDARTASETTEKIKPRVVFPMHYKTDKSDLPISGVDEFLKNKERVSRPDTSEVEFKQAELPVQTKIIVLKSAL